MNWWFTYSFNFRIDISQMKAINIANHHATLFADERVSSNHLSNYKFFYYRIKEIFLTFIILLY